MQYLIGFTNACTRLLVPQQGRYADRQECLRYDLQADPPGGLLGILAVTKEINGAPRRWLTPLNDFEACPNFYDDVPCKRRRPFLEEMLTEDLGVIRTNDGILQTKSLKISIRVGIMSTQRR